MSEQERPEHPGEWELVDGTGSGIRQFRQRVVGGWLVLVALEESNSLAFVPDPDGAWKPPIKQSIKRDGFF